MSMHSPTIRSSCSSPVNGSPKQRTSSPLQLTPRSKIQALLGALDETDSDKENGHDSRRKLVKAFPAPLPEHARSTTNETIKQVPISLDTSSDEGEHERQGPRGPMAARMQENSPDKNNSDARVEPSQAFPGISQDHSSSVLERNASSRPSAYDHIKRHFHEAINDTEPGQAFCRLPRHRRDEEEQTPDDDEERLNTPRSDLRKTFSGSFSPGLRQSSPVKGPPDLFVSPDKPTNEKSSFSSESEDQFWTPIPDGLGSRTKLQELIARKRGERFAREATAGHSDSADDVQDTKPHRIRAKKPHQVALQADSESDNDVEVQRKLTQRDRPLRKASKKALEEMSRETQRMNRSMQLVHQAKTKTKFTTGDFFKKMNFRQPKPEQKHLVNNHATSSSPCRLDSDEEGPRKEDTPPSSPPSLNLSSEKRPNKEQHAMHDAEQSEVEELPHLESLLSQAPRPATGSKNKLKPLLEVKSNSEPDRSEQPSARRFAKSARKQALPNFAEDDQDDDLEILHDRKPKHLAVFDILPTVKATQSHSLHALRALAHINEEEKRVTKDRRSLNATELKRTLQQKARQQALRERNQKIETLREKGIAVQTEEEKELDQMQIESMLEKARQEAEKIAKQEKEAAKREGKEPQDGSHLPDSDEDDEDYEEDDEDDEPHLSGSDEEPSGYHSASDDRTEEAERYDGEETKTQGHHPIMDDEAAEDQDQADDRDEASDRRDSEALVNDNDEQPPFKVHARWTKRVVVGDDTDSDEALDDEKNANTSNMHSVTAQPQAADIFGFGQGQPAAVNLSQVFAGTMAQSQTQDGENVRDANSQEDSLAFLRGLPQPMLPDFETLVEDSLSCVQNSQGTPGDQLPPADETERSSQPWLELQSPLKATQPHTQASETLDPTQDIGFQTNLSPARFDGAHTARGSKSTVETVLLPTQRSPGNQKRSRFRQRERPTDRETSQGLSEQDEKEKPGGYDGTHKGDAFQIMQIAAREPETSFDKKKSKAPEMFEEQAEESEDEYKGLGGASDDESQGDVDDEDRKMIDDESRVKLNERKVAAHYVDKERADDEMLLERLYKDINNGGFRRKRGADLDLFDSDDEEETIARRRAAKQREFAKMRRALLADEKIGKIAEDPKQQAFLQAIEDRTRDDDLDFLGDPEPRPSQIRHLSEDAAEGGSLALQNAIGSHKKLQRPVTESIQHKDGRDMFKKRRTNEHTKPTSLAEIRSTLSEIIGEPESVLDSQRPEEVEDVSSSDESFVVRDGEESEIGRESVTGMSTAANRRRVPEMASRNAVINRMAIKRAESSNTWRFNQAGPSNSRLAFHVPSRASHSGFRVPSLLRRATTNASNASEEATCTSISASAMGVTSGAGRDIAKVGGTKKSSINYHAREQERQAKVVEVERHRDEDRMKIGQMRRSGMGLGNLAGGRFA